MTEQIKIEPQKFEVKKFFGPFMARLELPEEVVVNLTKMSDDLLKNPNTPSNGQRLAGVIHDEKVIYQQDFIDAGVNEILEKCVKNYVYHGASDHYGNIIKDCMIQTQINSAWIVSQYENEYNPEHTHSGCEISGVIYLKTPKIKGRRKIPSKEGKPDQDGDIVFPYSSESQKNGEVLSKGVLQVEPRRGLMLLFPSWLLHTVYPFIGEGERRSISLNANYRIFMPTGKKQDGKEVMEWIAGDISGVQLQFPYWDKNKKIKGETK